jgi:hypothetical protein
MFKVLIEQISKAGRIQVPYLPAGAVHSLIRLLTKCGRGFAVVRLSEDFHAYLGPNLNHKYMAVVIHDFGQREIKALMRPRSGLHGGAKTGGRRLRAVHRNDKRGLTPPLIMGICESLPQKHPVLHPDGGEFTGTYAQESVSRWRAGIVEDSKISSVALHLEHP